MAKRQNSGSRKEKGPRRTVAASLRQEGLLFRCGHGPVQDLLFSPSTQGGGELWVITTTGACQYLVPPQEELEERPLAAVYEAPCGAGARGGDVLALAHLELRLFQPGADGTVAQSGLSGHRGSIFQVSLSDDGKLLLSLGEDEQLLVFQVAEGQILRQMTLASQPQCFCADWKAFQAVLGYADGKVDLWDLGSGVKLREVARFDQGVRGLWRHGDVLLVLDQAGQLWKDGKRFGASLESISAVHCSDAALFVGNEVGEVHVLSWDGVPIGVWEAHGDAICALTGPADGSWLASAAFRGPALWLPPWPPVGEEPALPQQCPLKDWQEEVLAQAVSPQGRFLATGGSEGQVVVRSLEDGRLLKAMEEDHGDCVTCLAFRGDEQALASGSSDGIIMVWAPRQGECLATLDGHDESITALLYEPSGQLLISGASDGLIILWHPETSQAVTQISGFDSGVVSLTLARGGESLIAHYEGGHCVAWDLTRHR